MAKHSGGLTFISLKLDPAYGSPLYQQLYQELREAILNGKLAPGTRLPSSRTLAKELDVSRNTVVAAFEQLLSEGYLEGQVGSGTYVSRALPDSLITVTKAANGSQTTTVANLPEKSFLKASYLTVTSERGAPCAFQPGVPALDSFPYKLWSKLVGKYWRSAPADLMSYGRTAGYLPFCKAIADYLKTARGVQCEPEQVIIIAGSQQGLDLTARVLLEPGDAVWLEDPGYIGARVAFLGAGANIVPVPLDQDGLDVQAGEMLCPDARLAFVTPSHQYPLGMTMSLARRLAILEWARKSNAWIVEDDYDSEFRYSGRPLASLQGLDKEGRVIYIGTFSKVLFPSLRLGYLVVPSNLIDAFSAARALTDQHSPLIDQAVLADFINEGYFSRHIRHMRALYLERQGWLLEAGSKYLDGLIELEPDAAGMHLIGKLPEHANDHLISEQATLQGIRTLPLSLFSIAASGYNGLLLGYAAFNQNQIITGVRVLSRILERGIKS